MAEGDILYEKDGDIAVVTLNRPHRMNALPMSVWTEELAAVWQDFDRDPSLRVAIFTATGERAFCTGVDVKETAERRARGEDGGERKPLKATPWQNNVRKPVICAVNGIVGGGGLMLVADCDVTIAGPNAAFFNPGVGVGIVRAGGPGDLGEHDALPRQHAHGAHGAARAVGPGTAPWSWGSSPRSCATSRCSSAPRKSRAR